MKRIYVFLLVLLIFCITGTVPHLLLLHTNNKTYIKHHVHEEYARERTGYLKVIGPEKKVWKLKPNFQELFALPSGENFVLKQTQLADLFLNVINKICTRTGRKAPELLQIPSWRSALEAEFKKDCANESSTYACDSRNPYRTIDGSCNNLLNPTWGTAGSKQRRYLQPQYDDGLKSPRTIGHDGLALPSPRLVSNHVHVKTSVNSHSAHLSVMVMQWGQFIDHDMVGTPVLKKNDGSSYNCCGADKNFEGCFPIPIPAGDHHFSSSCMNFVRSSPAVGLQCEIDVRQQMNKVTSYLDASAVYGSTKEEMHNLRHFESGLLKEGKYGLLPPSGKENCIKMHLKDECQMSGDDRTNVVPSIGAIHTVFMKEHNRLAREMASLNPHWNDEKIFQEVRRIVAAIIQRITYSDYLPLILGKQVMREYGLLCDLNRYVYNQSTDAGIANVFAAAAFRFGHSQIPNYQAYVGSKYRYRREFDISATFHRPLYLTYNRGLGVDNIMRWLLNDPQPETDRELVGGVRDLLFLQNNISLDLAAVNIQRGRDHGLPSYNQWREWCGLPTAKHFQVDHNGLIHHDMETARRLHLAYRHPDDIDVFTGGISERHVSGGTVGPLFACILGHQFKDLKYGDRFWYQGRDAGFTLGQIETIQQYSLSKIICSNTGIARTQKDAFLVPIMQDAERVLVRCQDLPSINLWQWRDPSQNTPTNNVPLLKKSHYGWKVP